MVGAWWVGVSQNERSKVVNDKVILQMPSSEMVMYADGIEMALEEFEG